MNNMMPDKNETITMPIILPMLPATVLLLDEEDDVWVVASEESGGRLKESIGWSKNDDDDDNEALNMPSGSLKLLKYKLPEK